LRLIQNEYHVSLCRITITGKVIAHTRERTQGLKLEKQQKELKRCGIVLESNIIVTVLFFLESGFLCRHRGVG